MREKNEDSHLAMKTWDSFLFVVADGLGGHPAGDVASAIVVSAFRECAEQSSTNGREFLIDALTQAQISILKAVRERPELSGMGTTLLAALVNPNGTCIIMNIGDSRGHIINGGITHTRDQNMAQAFVQEKILTEDQAMNHPLSKMLNQALGDIEPPVPDFYSFDMKGKYLLLSSDGLHGFIRKERIWEIVIAKELTLSGKVKLLLDQALQGGSDDNITAILARIEEKK